MKTILFASSILALATSVAGAEEIEMGTPTPTPTPTGPTDMSGGPFNKGTLGVSVGVTNSVALPSSTIDFVYFLDKKAAIDILAGIALEKTPGVTDPNTMMTVGGGTVFGFSVGVGYRIYKKINDHLHTYVQPYGLLSSADSSKIGDNLVIIAGANFGGEAFLTDWFSFRGQIGGAVAFGQKFEAISLASTTGLFANVYWK